MSAHSTTITGYEVKLGSLAVNRTARGVAIRNEKTYPVKEYGYINYYTRENERVSNGALVYSIDESGTLSDMMSEGQVGSIELKDSDLVELRNEISSYQKSFRDGDFSSVYNFKYHLDGVAARLTNEGLLEALQSLSGNVAFDNSIAMGYADTSGIVVFGTDGLEGLIPQNVGPDTFDEEKHPTIRHLDNTIVSISDNAFKLSLDEDWTLVIPWNPDWEGEKELEEGKYVNVRFLKNGLTSYGRISRYHNEGGDYLGLTFTNSMVTFATDRYLDIELLTNEKSGLKIPNTAMVERDFYVIPREFMTKGGDSDSNGFLRRIYLEDGSMSTEFLRAEVYDEDVNGVYIDTGLFSPGDTIIMPDSPQSFTVGPRATLTGVYNMNNGYTDFTKVHVLYSNKEYSIVESGTMYGLNVYDHIVLNGADVEDNDFVYQ